MGVALITGVGGQDGSLLAERLTADGHKVVGVDTGTGVADRLDALGLRDRVRLIEVDLCEPDAVREAVASARPSAIFHLAAMSFVPDSWLHPVPSTRVGVLPTAALLDAVLAVDPAIHLVMASSSEVFGHAPVSPQDESTPLAPITPYGAAKAFCLSMGRMYRSRFDLRVSSAILYSHESPRRPERFVSRKVTRAAAAIALGRATELRMGDLAAERDWSYAGDVVDGLMLMAQQEVGDDYVLASGVLHSVEDLLEVAFRHVDLDWRDYVVIDPEFVRPGEDHRPCGSPAKAQRVLGWDPKVDFAQLVAMMVDADLADLQR